MKSDCPVWCPLFVSLFVVVSYFFVVQLLQAQSPHPSFVVPGNVLDGAQRGSVLYHFLYSSMYNYLNLIIVIFRK